MTANLQGVRRSFFRTTSNPVTKAERRENDPDQRNNQGDFSNCHRTPPYRNRIREARYIVLTSRMHIYFTPEGQPPPCGDLCRDHLCTFSYPFKAGFPEKKLLMFFQQLLFNDRKPSSASQRRRQHVTLRTSIPDKSDQISAAKESPGTLQTAPYGRLSSAPTQRKHLPATLP